MSKASSVSTQLILRALYSVFEEHDPEAAEYWMLWVSTYDFQHDQFAEFLKAIPMSNSLRSKIYLRAITDQLES